jgi:GYF domain 2
MTLYLTKNGTQAGPYTFEQVQEFIRDGHVRDTDLAWSEGMPAWVPLRDIPGFVVPKPTRPIGVWIISLLFFTCMPCSLLGLVGVAMMQSGAIPVQHEQAEALQQLGPLYYIVTLLNTGLVLIWAVLFFLLKRASIWFLIASLGLGLVYMLYTLAAHGTIAPGNPHPLVTGVVVGIMWMLNAALLYYNWHLIRKGVMR